jgi:formate hydrogenlyase subunit 3/multisubunit Na+/H+ antiporter MnhD subunit
MSGVMLKTAIYGLVRVTFDLLHVQIWWWGAIALAIGLTTALFGVVFAAAQTDMKRLLAYSSIENIGVIVSGIALAILFAPTTSRCSPPSRSPRRSITASIMRSSRACSSSPPARSCTRRRSGASVASAA